MSDNEQKLIMLSDFIETRLRKEKELEFYQKELEKLQQKMFFIKKDIDVTNIIIKMIQSEKIIDFQEQMEARLLLKNNDENT
jgi:hypothetical protein